MQISSWSSKQPVLQILFCFAIIMISAYHQMKSKPFNSEICNDLEIKSLIASGIVIFLGIYFIGVSETHISFDYLAIIIFFSANAYFIISWIIEYVKSNEIHNFGDMAKNQTKVEF